MYYLLWSSVIKDRQNNRMLWTMCIQFFINLYLIFGYRIGNNSVFGLLSLWQELSSIVTGMGIIWSVIMGGS